MKKINIIKHPLRNEEASTDDLFIVVKKINEIIDYLEDKKSSAQIVEINGNNYITEDKNLMKYSLSTSGECNYSFDSSLPSNPPIAVCSKCGFQKKGSPESEKQDFGEELKKFMKYEGYTDFQIEQMKDFLSSNTIKEDKDFGEAIEIVNHLYTVINKLSDGKRAITEKSKDYNLKVYQRLLSILSNSNKQGIKDH